MDDRVEREAALYALSSYKEEILKLCEDCIETLDAFEELNIITTNEKDDANEREDYTGVIANLIEKINTDPSFFVEFCRHIKQFEELCSIAAKLLGVYSATLTGQSVLHTSAMPPEVKSTEYSTSSVGESTPSVIRQASSSSNIGGSTSSLQDSSSNIGDFGSSIGGSSTSITDSTSTPASSVVELGNSKVDGPLQKLKERLSVFQGIPCESEEVKQNVLKMTETALKNFITTCLDMGVSAHTVHMVLENLHTKDIDIVIDGDAYQWCIKELEKQNKIRNPDSPSLHEINVQLLNEVNFCKEVVQNSIVACHLLEQPDINIVHLSSVHSLFEVNKSTPLRLDSKKRRSVRRKDEFHSDLLVKSSAESPCESNCEMIELSSTMTHTTEAVHQYLIAKGAVKPSGHVIYYIAFSSHQNLREWSDSYPSFEKGLKKQQEQLPIQFILERLWEGASVVLTGFSFGGLLAQFCATYLWNLSQGICLELLKKNLLCITFGQPIMTLSRIMNFADRSPTNKSRFHAIYISDDIVPRMLRYLDPVYTESAISDTCLPEKFRGRISLDEIFQNHLSTLIMRQLVILQEYKEEHTSSPKVASDGIRQKLSEKLQLHHASEEVSKHRPTRLRRHKLSDEEKVLVEAIQDLRALLRLLKRQRSPAQLSTHMTCEKLGIGEFRECKTSDLEFPGESDIHENLFRQHNTTYYLQEITSKYTKKPPKINFEEADTLPPGNFVKPLVRRLEIHHFSHNKTAALSLEGNNLCFTSKIVLDLDKSQKEHEIAVAQKESVSSRSIQIHNVSLPIPRDFGGSTDSTTSNDYQESTETACVTLITNFGEVSFENIEVRHKKFHISCRRQQVANLSVAEVIELSFLGALLERHPRTSSYSTSKRYRVIQKFLEVIVEIVPVESVFSCIANMASDHDARHLCHTLKLANMKPPLSLTFFINAALAITKLRGEAVQFHDRATLEDLFFDFFVVAKKRALPLLSFSQSAPQSVDEAKYLKWFGHDISSQSRNSDMVRYLQLIVEDAINHSTGRIPAISGISIKSLFEATEKLCVQNRDSLPTNVKSPISLLKEGQIELQNLQSIARDRLKSYPGAEQDSESFTKANNTMLLDYVNKLRNEDLHTCIKTIIAFMEEQVRIPISDFQLSVSYWKLLKLGLGIFRREVSKDFVTQYVSVSKHIRGIADETGHTIDPDASSSIANSKYAGKLQFLLSASLRNDEPPLFDDKFLMYSLENHLYTRFTDTNVPKNQRIDESTPLYEIEEKWDILFKGVAMSTVVHSHRRLVARWLKFSLLIHKLRAELSCHATVGIIGLVNSGKSTLVKELFRIEAVETGTRAEKRTTVPFLYSIQGVENFDVIDFPGVDDQDDHISDLVNLLRTLSQLVVFVVNYRNAHTKVAVEWYRKLNQYAIPHLVCLTHGDRLYAECVDEEQNGMDVAYTKKAIKKQVEIIHDKIVAKASDSPMRCLGLFSLKVDNDSLLKSREGQMNIRDAGIRGVKDVGRWIVKSLEVHLKEVATAQMLKSYLRLT